MRSPPPASRRGDKVALILPQRPETAIAHIARAIRLGAVAVPLSFLFGPEALEYRLQHSAAKIAFVDPQSLPNLLPIRERCPALAARRRRRRRDRRPASTAGKRCKRRPGSSRAVATRATDPRC